MAREMVRERQGLVLQSDMPSVACTLWASGSNKFSLGVARAFTGPLSVLLVAYVNDFKMAGPKAHRLGARGSYVYDRPLSWQVQAMLKSHQLRRRTMHSLPCSISAPPMVDQLWPSSGVVFGKVGTCWLVPGIV